MTDALVVLLTFPTEDAAAQIGRTLVEERLLACANLVPAIRSIYRWQGAIHDERETLVLGKTTRAKLDALQARLPQLHPYDTPELLALPVEAGLERYLGWVRESVA